MAKAAKLMPSLRRSHQGLSISNLFNTTKQNPSLFTSKLHPVSQITTTRSYVLEMRKAAFSDNIRIEIHYELQHSPSNQTRRAPCSCTGELIDLENKGFGSDEEKTVKLGLGRFAAEPR